MTQTLSQLEHSEAFIGRHIGPSSQQQQDMLETVGAGSLNALIQQIVPVDIQLPGPPAVGDAVTEHQALAELIELLLVALLLLHPVVYLLRNIPRDLQSGAGFLPRFSERLLFLCEPPGRFGLTLELLRQGVDLPEDQQTFFFQRGDLFFQRVAAALIIRDR